MTDPSPLTSTNALGLPENVIIVLIRAIHPEKLADAADYCLEQEPPLDLLAALQATPATERERVAQLHLADLVQGFMLSSKGDGELALAAGFVLQQARLSATA